MNQSLISQGQSDSTAVKAFALYTANTGMTLVQILALYGPPSLPGPTSEHKAQNNPNATGYDP